MLVYKLDMKHKGQYSPCRRGLEAKVKATHREVSKLSAEEGQDPQIPRRYNKLSITEALETVKHKLRALAIRLKRYSREAEGE